MRLSRRSVSLTLASTRLIAAIVSAMIAGNLQSASAAEGSTKASTPSASPFVFGCGPFPDTAGVALLDYRDKKIEGYESRQIAQVDHYHTEPALKEMNKPKPYGIFVADNLAFTLRHVPNHYVALRAAIDWDLRGGRFYSFPSVNCYLEWAHRYAPQDSTVLQLGGIYFLKKGNPSLAREWFKLALEVEPGSAEAHYNLGLMLFDLKDFDGARIHARAAYAAGYPLPGLRNKLARAGYPLAP